MITTVCKISYGSQTVPPIVPAVQGDTGRAISFEIADFTPPAGATATYFILKPSGEAIYNSATITDNSILCELTAQSLAEAGENRMQVRVLQGENIVTSFEVILMVRTFLGDDAIQSGTEMNIFDQLVAQATEDFQTNAEQIVEEVIESIPSDYTALTDEVDELNERLDNEGLSEDAKVALLNCFAHVAWIDEHGQDYFGALSAALYPNEYPKITATFTPGSHVVYTDDAISTLIPYLVVKYFEDEQDSGTTISSNNYTLSGILTEGQNSILVTYGSLSTTFNVTAIDFYNIRNWALQDNLVVNQGNRVSEYTTTIVSNPGMNNRAVVTCNHGKGGIYNYNNGSPTLFNPKRYPIPIPTGAKSVTIQCSSNTWAQFQVFRYTGGDTYQFVYQYANEVYGGTTYTLNSSHQGENMFAFLLCITPANTLPTVYNLSYGF